MESLSMFIAVDRVATLRWVYCVSSAEFKILTKSKEKQGKKDGEHNPIVPKTS